LESARWQNRSHFYGLAAQIMRRVLVDHARSRAFQNAVAMRERIAGRSPRRSPQRSPDIVALDEALTRLAAIDERKS